MTTRPHAADLHAPAAPPETDRLAAIEKRLDELKPSSKDRWDKFEKVSTGLWAVLTFFLSLFVTGRIETALKERELHLENVKDMQELMKNLDQADAGAAMSFALALGAHGRYAVAPLLQVLQAGIPEHRAAAEAGLRAAAAIDKDFVCRQLTGVVNNRTRLYQVEVHESSAQLLGDLDCTTAIDALTRYVGRLETMTPANAPFTKVPAARELTQGNIDDVKGRAQTSLEALSTAKREGDADGKSGWFGGGA